MLQTNIIRIFRRWPRLIVKTRCKILYRTAFHLGMRVWMDHVASSNQNLVIKKLYNVSHTHTQQERWVESKQHNCRQMKCVPCDFFLSGQTRITKRNCALMWRDRTDAGTSTTVRRTERKLNRCWELMITCRGVQSAKPSQVD